MKWRPFQFSRHRKPARKPIRRTILALEELEVRLTPTTTDVLTYHNDSAATGQNLNELALTPVNVNSTTFGKLFSTNVDGQVYAQPLYKANVNITVGANKGTHNVVFVATEHDSLYAIDAANGNVLWQDSLLNPVHGGTVTTVPNSDVNSDDISPEIGITATPVIDASTGTIYVEAKTKEVAADGTHYIHQLYAINIRDGSYKDGGPVVIADSIGDTYVSGPTVPGTGDGSSNGTVYFDALRQQDRPGLLEANGNIYLAFASHGDNGPYHGWLLSYNVTNLQLNGVLNTTPNGNEGGIWESGDHVDVDSEGNLYFATGNGTFDTTLNSSGMPSNGDYGDSYVKVAVDPTSTAANPNINGWGLKVVDYFTPYEQGTLDSNDLDLGSGGLLLLPDSAGSTAHPHLMIGAGKEGRIYLIDRDNMGHFDPNGDHIVEETSLGTINGSWSTPAYYNGNFYYMAQNDFGKLFSISDGVMSATPTSQSNDSYAYPGASPSISAFGALNSILWATDVGTNELRAYSTSDLTNELYNSDQAVNGRDVLTGSAVKFAVPTIANGQVFVGSSDALNVYGLLTPATTAPAAPSGLTASTASESSIQLSWTDNSTSPNLASGFAIEESTNGGVTFAPVGTTGAGTTSFTVDGLQVATPYTFRVYAFNTAGKSADSNLATDTTLSQFVITGFPSPTTAGTAESFTVTAEDANGNVVTDYGGTVHFTSTDPQAVLPPDYTFSTGDQGVHTFSATLDTAGVQSLTATDTLSSTVTGAQTGITITPAATTALVFSNAPTSATAGSGFNVTLTAEDAYGNMVSNYGGTVAFTSSDAKAALPPEYTFGSGDAGQHVFSVAFKTVGTQTLTATDIATSSLTATTSGIPVTPAAASSFTITTPPTEVLAGTGAAFTVTAYDIYGNIATGYTGTVHFTSSDAKALLPANYHFTSANQGTHVFNVTFETAGSQSLSVTDTNTSSLTGSATGITVDPAAASALIFSPLPSIITAGSTFMVTLTAIDAFGNIANNFGDTIHFSSSDPEPVLPVDYTFISGTPAQHTFNITLVTAGKQSLTAQDTTTSSFSVSENDIVVTPGAATSLSINGLPTPVIAGTPYSITIRAVDPYGNTANDYEGTVHFTSTDTAAVLPADYTFTAADNSVHTFTNAITFGTQGLQTLTVADTVAHTVKGTATLQISKPSIASLSPNSVDVGSADLVVTISGDGFVPQTTVTFGKTTLTPTTVNSATQLSVTIPAKLLKTPGNVNVTVTNPLGSGTIQSDPAIFAILGVLLPPPPPPPFLSGSNLPTTATIVNVANQYPGPVQLETVTVTVTNSLGITINQGVAAIQVNGQTVYAPVHNGIATASVATSLFDFGAWMDLFFAHSLTVNYGDRTQNFGSSSASSTLPPILLDFLIYEMVQQLVFLQSNS